MIEICSAIVSGSGFVFCLFLLFLLIQAIWLGVQSKRWPTTIGKVKQSHVEGVGNQYRELLLYEYTVKGSNYISHFISFPDRFLLVFMGGKRSKRAAEYMIAKYPVDSEVTVYYDANNPKRAVLETEVWNINVAIITVTLMIIIIGGIFIFIEKLF